MYLFSVCVIENGLIRIDMTVLVLLTSLVFNYHSRTVMHNYIFKPSLDQNNNAYYQFIMLGRWIYFWIICQTFSIFLNLINVYMDLILE